VRACLALPPYGGLGFVESMACRLEGCRSTPKAYPPEFRARAVSLVRAGKPVREAAREPGISESCLHNWVKQDRIDRGESAGLSSKEHADLVVAKRRIRQLETELEILPQLGTHPWSTVGAAGPVLDAFSRKIVGWSIDTTQNTNLVVNALDMAISNRNPKPGTVFHSDHGVQPAWSFTNRVKEAGLMP
jgi:transposase